MQRTAIKCAGLQSGDFFIIPSCFTRREKPLPMKKAGRD